MNITRVFVSSTCYDLSAVRESLRDKLQTLGHQPVLSEYASFPVSPDLTAVENCRVNVRNNCDLLVLIVGGRYGFKADESGRSITNIEYDTAKAAGRPCFIFIKKSVRDLMPVWKKNPEADFSDQVDNPQVFRFVQKIWDENQWTFFFESCKDIEDTLSIQLSGMMRDLLVRKQNGTLEAPDEYKNESLKAQELARDKPQFWEFSLTAELLRGKLSKIRSRYDRVTKGVVFIPATSMKGRDFITWILDQFGDLTNFLNAVSLQTNNLERGWGPPGVPGDPIEILEATNDLISLATHVVDWETKIRTVRLHGDLQLLCDKMSGLCENVLATLESIPAELVAPFSDGKTVTPGTVISIQKVFSAAKIEEFNEELAILSKKPDLLLALSRE